MSDPLQQYCEPAPLEGADLLSYYYLLQTFLEREPATLSISNTVSNSKYLKLCRETDRDPHPARFPRQLVEYFIPRLTRPGDIVLDPFAGSNMVGRVAASQNRQWLAFDVSEEYLETSELRFKQTAAVTQQADPNQTAVSEFGTPQ